VRVHCSQGCLFIRSGLNNNFPQALITLFEKNMKFTFKTHYNPTKNPSPGGGKVMSSIELTNPRLFSDRPERIDSTRVLRGSF
jgi:hypothetical protein